MTDLDILSSGEVKQFIQSNLQSDVSKLLLNPPSGFKTNIKLIANQILSRQKAKGKLDRWLSHPDLLFPPPLSIEQASSDQTANYKKDLLKGKHLVDLTGGMGMDCLTISEHFDEVTYVERDKDLCDVFRHNATALSREVTIKNQTAEQFLDQFNSRATFFFDPARRDANKNKIFQLEDCSPNPLQLLPALRQKANSVLIKLSPLLDISHIIQEMPGLKELHILSVKNDCKELLALIEPAFYEEPLLICQNLGSNDKPFRFKLSSEKNSNIVQSEISRFIYEPNSSIMKAGAFKSIGNRYDLKKLGLNTHLYTSEELNMEFPGRKYEILEEVKNPQVLSRYADKGYINVVTRNYPLSAIQLKKKYKMKDGGDYYLLGFRDLNEKPKLVVAKRLDR